MLIVYLLCQGGFMFSFQMPCRVAGCPPGREELNEQITAELVVQRRQLRVVAFRESWMRTSVGSFVASLCAQINRYATEQR